MKYLLSILIMFPALVITIIRINKSCNKLNDRYSGYHFDNLMIEIMLLGLCLFCVVALAKGFTL